MCRICNYNQVKHVDRALLAGVPPAELSRRYAFTAAELARHQQHLLQKMTLAQKRFHDHLHLGLYCKLNIVMEMVLRVVRQALGSQDNKFFLQASREFTRIVNLMDKIAARLQVDPEFIYCLLANPQWDLQEDSHLPSAFQALAEIRQTLKQNLFASCPEPEPDFSNEINHSPAAGTDDAELENLPFQTAGAIRRIGHPETGHSETTRDIGATPAGR